MPEVTKADRDNRKRYIDDLVKMLVDDGMSATKAKQKAAERYDEDHPWFKQTTRGKVYVNELSISDVANGLGQSPKRTQIRVDIGIY
jgi:hypothetical protein